jgi:hypothetical protein
LVQIQHGTLELLASALCKSNCFLLGLVLLSQCRKISPALRRTPVGLVFRFREGFERSNDISLAFDRNFRDPVLAPFSPSGDLIFMSTVAPQIMPACSTRPPSSPLVTLATIVPIAPESRPFGRNGTYYTGTEKLIRFGMGCARMLEPDAPAGLHVLRILA